MKVLFVICFAAVSLRGLEAWELSHYPDRMCPPEAEASVHTSYMGRLHETSEHGHEHCVGSFSGTNVFHHHTPGEGWSSFSVRCKELLGGILHMVSGPSAGCRGRTAVDLDMKSRIVNHNRQEPCCTPCPPTRVVVPACPPPVQEIVRVEQPTTTVVAEYPHHHHHHHVHQPPPHHHHHHHRPEIVTVKPVEVVEEVPTHVHRPEVVAVKPIEIMEDHHHHHHHHHQPEIVQVSRPAPVAVVPVTPPPTIPVIEIHEERKHKHKHKHHKHKHHHYDEEIITVRPEEHHHIRYKEVQPYTEEIVRTQPLLREYADD